MKTFRPWNHAIAALVIFSTAAGAAPLNGPVASPKLRLSNGTEVPFHQPEVVKEYQSEFGILDVQPTEEGLIISPRNREQARALYGNRFLLEEDRLEIQRDLARHAVESADELRARLSRLDQICKDGLCMEIGRTTSVPRSELELLITTRRMLTLHEKESRTLAFFGKVIENRKARELRKNAQVYVPDSPFTTGQKISMGVTFSSLGLGLGLGLVNSLHPGKEGAKVSTQVKKVLAPVAGDSAAPGAAGPVGSAAVASDIPSP